jgi:endonuclease/exonuclease/phosphatase family metal-dependent hydrolase
LTAYGDLGDEKSMLRRRAGRLCCFALLLHCGGGDSDEPGPATQLSLVTFNAALGVGLAPYADQRLEVIEADLTGLGADVICLQEVWQPETLAQLTEDLAADFPYNHRSVSALGAASTCTEAEASLLATCLSDNCGSVERDALPLCAIASCADPFTQVSMECQQCIAANQTATDVTSLTTLCSPAGEGAAAYADQTGLVILSRFPLEAPSYAAFESSLGDRGLLSARVRTSFMGDVGLHCTHLAATLGDVPYTGAYGSWSGERIRQIEQMLGRVDELRSPGSSEILLGDMNCGPATPLAESASPDAYARLVDAGFVDPYANDDGRCTFCRNNPLNGLVEDPEEGALIDHVLISSSRGERAEAARVFDEEISVNVDGSSVVTARSDHYGVRVLLRGGAP